MRRHHRWSFRTTCAIALAGIVLSTSCTSRTGAPAAPGDTNTIETPGVVKQYPDRPAADVDAGLSTLIPCDLADQGVLDRHGIPRLDREIRDEHGIPHRGLGTPKRNGEAQSNECRTVDYELFGAVSVRLDTEFTVGARHTLNRVEIGGFTAYEGDISIEGEAMCTTAFPISFNRAVEFVVKARPSEDAYDPCQAASDLANAAVPRITAAAGESFLYRPDEKDENAEGACVHFLSRGTRAGCVPYRKPTFPADPKTMVERAHSNANISCAAALSTVRDVLGRTMQAVTFGQSCNFVEPTHTVTASVFMSPGYRAADYDREEDNRPTEVGGHPAVVTDSGDSDGSHAGRDYVIATGSDAKQYGVVGVEVRVSVGRGKSSYTAKADVSKLDLADTIAERIMARYF